LAVLTIGGSALVAGCPFGLDLGSLFGSAYDAIPDGRYEGDGSATVEFWQYGELVNEESNDTATFAAFSGGALLKDSGGRFQLGDVDTLVDGAYVITREVFSIDYGDWGYEIAFDLTAEWNSIPMTGLEVATYWLNDDGTIDLYDEIELTSDDWYDGGAWTIHSDSYVTLVPDYGTTPSSPPENILDKKSGKIRR
jgi:hypothetical protein